MAKATVITPTMQINTGRAPTGINNVPAQGQAVRVDVFFDAATPSVDVSMTAVMQNGCFTTIQCLFIDNSLNPATVIITLPGIQQRIIVNGFSQALEPLYVSDSACGAPINVYCNTKNAPGFPVSLWFSNVPQPFYTKTGLINNVYIQGYSINVGNLGGGWSYNWTIGLTAAMQNNDVADWPFIWVDNSLGFQHLYVYDNILGTVIYIVNPYTIAQFPTPGLGGDYYTFKAYDMILGTPQAAFNYGYVVPIFFKSNPQPFYDNFCGTPALYTAIWDQAFLANGTVLLPVIESRKRTIISAPNPFFYGVGIALGLVPALLVNGQYVGSIDITSSSTIALGVRITNGAIAQNMVIRDRY